MNKNKIINMKGVYAFQLSRLFCNQIKCQVSFYSSSIYEKGINLIK